MVHGAVHLLFRVLGAVFFLLLLAAGLFTWRLSQGPVSLDLLTPYIEEMLAGLDDDMRLTLGGTQLTWERGDRELDLRAVDVRAVDAKGAVLAAVPQIGIVLKPEELLRGQVRLAAVEVISPHIRLRRDTEGNVHFGMWQSGAGDEAAASEGADEIVEALLRGLRDDAAGPVADLGAVRIVRADATIVDEAMGAVWRIPQASVELLRGIGDRIDIAGRLEVALPDGTTHLDVNGLLHPEVPAVTLEASFSGLRPASLAAFAADLEPLGALDVPLDGSLSVNLALAPRLMLQDASLTLAGGAGTLRLPSPVQADYAIDGLTLSVSVSAVTDAVLVETLEIGLVPPEGTEAPGPTRVRVAGSLGRDVDGGMSGEIAAAVQNVPVDALRQWWPEEVAPNPRKWVTQQLSGGAVLRGEWAATLAGETLQALDVTALSGSARVEGVTVDYLPPMPKATKAAADLIFALDTITLVIAEGEVAGLGGPPLEVEGGVIAFHDLDKKDSTAVINLAIEGGLYQALRLIDHQPLGYTSTLGLSPKGAEGQVRTDLKMAFPLLADLPLDALTVEARAVIDDAFLPGAVFGRDLSGGDLTLAVDTSVLEARGQAYIGGVPAGFVWREIFSGKPFRSHYSVRAVVQEDKRDVFGLDFAPFTAPFLTGPVRAEVDFKVIDKARSTIDARVDLTTAGMEIPGFDWVKQPGQPACGTASVLMAGDTVREVPRFTIEAPKGSRGPLVAEGRVRLHDSSDLDRIDFARLELGETVLDGSVVVQPDGTWDIAVRGPAFDATPFIAGGPRGPDIHPEQALEDDGVTLPPLRISGDFDVVWLADDGTIEEVQAHLDHRDDSWRSARLEGMLEGRTPFRYLLTPADPGVLDGNRVFSASTEDAGALLRSLDLIGTVRGGRLEASGTVDPAGTATGRLQVENYRLVQAPVLAQLLSVAALTGIVDALTGEGISFQALEAPFSYRDDVLAVKDFRTYGPSLGMTGDGTIDLGRDEFALSGTLVPAYALNSLLGKLPLIGGLLTGFEKDGGMFAASYSVRGPTGSPEIRVNPLTALAPGFLRNIFGSMAPPEQPAQ